MDWRKRSESANCRLRPLRGSVRCRSMSAPRPRCSSNSRGSSSPASEVTVAPRNSTRSWGLNERRIGPDIASPIGWCPPRQRGAPESRVSWGVERLWPWSVHLSKRKCGLKTVRRSGQLRRTRAPRARRRARRADRGPGGGVALRHQRPGGVTNGQLSGDLRPPDVTKHQQAVAHSIAEPPAGALGVAIFVDERLTGLDLFQDADLFGRLGAKWLDDER